MKIILILPFAILLASCASEPTMKYSKDGRFGSECNSFCSVTLAQLVITPERYHGKIVQVYGLLSVNFEGYGVSSGEHEIWVEMSKGQIEKYKKYDGKVGYVKGIFDGTNTGHFGMWGGAIHSVTRFGK